MQRKIELLAPGGDIDSIKAAILAGADAVYCGLDRFNARNRAANIGFDELQGILRLAHKHDCRVFLTLNIIIVESELPALFKLLNKLVNTGIDGIIVQDLGLLYILSSWFSSLKVHASTQLTTHNRGQVLFLGKLGVMRINLSRELNINEIRDLTTVCHDHAIQAEVFVHGSYCISFSGLCYMSSVHSGNSGNRGRCSQPCRDQYATTQAGKDYPLNLKDNSSFGDLRELAEAGVDSLKIEGRIKKFHYVYTVVDAWRKQLDRFHAKNEISLDNRVLYKVFNRDFSNDFLSGTLSKDMFIDNPRDHSAIYMSGVDGPSTADRLEKAKGDVYDERTGIIQSIENQIEHLDVAKAPLVIRLSGEEGSPLKISVTTPDSTFSVSSETRLARTGAQSLSHEVVLTKLKALNDTAFFIERIELDELHAALFFPFKDLSILKNKILYILNDARESVAPIDVPVLNRFAEETISPGLSVLISSTDDLYLCKDASITVYFQLPNSIHDDFQALTDIFVQNDRLLPWFPSILIGEDYDAALKFLNQIRPLSIVTNNTGIAFEASLCGIPWIAGPHLNIVNSFSLICLKEKFSCAGAFVSNELSSTQVKALKKPEDFGLFYSIYHPNLLMTSRQCLFHQIEGCQKNKIDDTCIQHCERSSIITNLKGVSSFINKEKGNYHTVYHETNYLNTNIIGEISGFFSGYLIDLRDVGPQPQAELDKPVIIRHFEGLLKGNTDSENELLRILHQTSNKQYVKGI